MSRRDQLRARRQARGGPADRPPLVTSQQETPPPASVPWGPDPHTWPVPGALLRPGVGAPDVVYRRSTDTEPRDAAEGLHPDRMTELRGMIGQMNGPQLAVVLALAFTRAREIGLTLSAPVGLVDVPTWRLLNERTEVVGKVWWENGEWRTR